MGCTRDCLYRIPLNLPQRPPFRNYSSRVTPLIKRWMKSKNLSKHMSDKKVILQSILDQGMLPLFYWDSPTVSLEVIRALYMAGVRSLEYTNRGPAPLDNFRFLKKELSAEPLDLYLGIRTVTPAGAPTSFINPAST